MKNFIKKNTFFLVWLIFMAIFNVIALAVPDLSTRSTLFWWGFAFINIAFVAVAVVSFALKMSSTKIFNNVFFVYALSIGYFAVTLIYNVILMFVNEGSAIWAIVPNVVIVLVYVALMIVSNRAVTHMSEDAKVVQEKVGNLRVNVVKISTLLYKVTDADVKKALTNLKETLDYSDPMGVAATADIEAEFEGSLDVLKELISSGTEKEGVLNAINDSLALLKARNDLLKASK
ncbi:MAG: hypothetical protein IJX49_01320 [Clostridia bacterium]|nr:hypothetical protein [Clostridia bacterium]